MYMSYVCVCVLSLLYVSVAIRFSVYCCLRFSLVVIVTCFVEIIYVMCVMCFACWNLMYSAGTQSATIQ